MPLWSQPELRKAVLCDSFYLICSLLSGHGVARLSRHISLVCGQRVGLAAFRTGPHFSRLSSLEWAKVLALHVYSRPWPSL